jgi:branched-chain amino acid transport system permease protein
MAGSPLQEQAKALPGIKSGLLSGSMVRHILVFGVLLFLPYLLSAAGSYPSLGTFVLVWGLAAMGFNLLFGYTGALSFGHAAFLGVGAYVTGLTIKLLIPNTLIAIILGTVAGALSAALLGLLITRLRGIYFSMLTIAFGQMFYFVAFQWRDVTGGDDGLRGFERQPLHLGSFTVDLLHNDIAFYYFSFVLFFIAVVLMRWIITSPTGRTFLALRENEQRARFLGISVERYLWLSFVISAGFTSLGGSLLGLLINFADPTMLYWTTSGQIVMMAFLGGTRSFYGPLLGAGIFKILQDLLSSYTRNWMIFLGVLFIIFVLFFPRGVAGLFDRRRS